MTSHSTIVGGSTANRVLNCPGSRKLVKQVPPEKGSSIYAERGTALHECMEIMLNTDTTLVELEGYAHDNGYVVTANDVDYALTQALQQFNQFMEDHEIMEYETETKVSFKRLAGVFGSADVILRSEDTAYVLDWKFGQSPVAAENNDQGFFYATAASQTPEVADMFEGATNVAVVIIQPDCYDEAQIWQFDPVLLDEFEDALTEALDSELLAEGSHCKWCPAQYICPLKRQHLATITNAEIVTRDNLLQILEVADQVESLIKQARTMGHTLLSNGQDLPGWKLVPKQARRQYAEPETVEAFCKKSRKLKMEDYYDLKLKSPAQMEKVFKSKGVDFTQLSDYIVSVSSGTNMTRDDNPRQAPEKLAIPEHMAKLMN